MGCSSVLKSLLTVFVFIILAVCSVESYKCLQAVYGNGRLLETSAPCETNNGCFNHIHKLEAPGSNGNTVFEQKGCNVDKNTCDLEFSITLGNQLKFKYKNQCCTSEQCNKENVTVSQPSEVNGVECTACSNQYNSMCFTTTTLKCMGAERKCVEFTSTGESSNLVLYGKGCATENTCSLDIKLISNIRIKTSCIPAVSTNGSPTFKSVASLPIVLLLLKILL